MRPDIRPGGIFPDYALPDHTGTVRTLSELQGRDPLILTLARGNYCPKEHQQHLELAANYPKVAVAYTQIATIATDDHHTLQEFRASVGAQWTFLSDPGRTVQQDLDIAEYTDPEHNPMIPHTLVLKPGLVVHSVYNGYWFWGRPSFYDLWHDLRAATSEIRPDWDLSTPGLREAWDAGDYSKFHGWDRRAPESAPTSYVTQRERKAWPVAHARVRRMRDARDRAADCPGTDGCVSPPGGGGLGCGRAGHADADVVRGRRSRRPGDGGADRAAVRRQPGLTEDQHRRLDPALEAGLRIVSFMWGIPAATSSRCTPPGGS